MPTDDLGFANGHLLVETDWLAAHLGDRDLRVFDCTTKLIPDPEIDYRVEGDREGWAAGHIPGAGYINCQDDLSATPHRYRFMLPDPEEFARKAGALGIGDETRVVLYSRTQPFWSTRAWWSLYAMGFDRAAVLHGGYAKWLAEGRPVSTEETRYPAAVFTPRPRAGAVVDRDEMRALIGAEGVAIVNALAPEQFHGTGGMDFGRPGRIPGTVNVPYREVCDMETGRFADIGALADMFARAGATVDKRVVNYCGGGISATLGFFAQRLLGYEDIALYDASMQEWAADPDLPMERG